MQFHSIAVDPRHAILFAIPNGEDRHPIVAAKLVGISAANRERLAEVDPWEALRPFGQGELPGALDLELLLPGGRTERIEVKRPRNEDQAAGRLSKAQKRFVMALEHLGHGHHRVESLEQYADLLEGFGVRLRCRPAGPGIPFRVPKALKG